jgi:hypothetical protein
LDNLALINFSLSTNVTTSWLEIGPYGIRLRTPIGSFGNPFELTFHNWIRSLSVGLQMLSVNVILYCIIGHLDKCIKNLKICKLICPTKVSNLSFKQPRAQVLKSRIF